MYKLVHNGMDITWHNTIADVNVAISNILKTNTNLNPRMKYNYKLESNSTFICYEYKTLYCEMFLIVEEE